MLKFAFDFVRSSASLAAAFASKFINSSSFVIDPSSFVISRSL